MKSVQPRCLGQVPKATAIAFCWPRGPLVAFPAECAQRFSFPGAAVGAMPLDAGRLEASRPSSREQGARRTLLHPAPGLFWATRMVWIRLESLQASQKPSQCVTGFRGTAAPYLSALHTSLHPLCHPLFPKGISLSVADVCKLPTSLLYASCCNNISCDSITFSCEEVDVSSPIPQLSGVSALGCRVEPWHNVGIESAGSCEMATAFLVCKVLGLTETPQVFTSTFCAPSVTRSLCWLTGKRSLGQRGDSFLSSFPLSLPIRLFLSKLSAGNPCKQREHLCYFLMQ